MITAYALSQRCTLVTNTAARSRDDGCMAPSSPPTLDAFVRLGGHGSAGPGSDLDLLVEFPASPSVEQYMDLKLALGISFHSRADNPVHRG